MSHLARILLRDVFGVPALPVPAAFVALGERAFELTRTFCELGQRYPGSDAIARAQELISSTLSPFDCEVETVPFTAETPIGHVPMCNYVAKFKGRTGRTILLSGHYDTIRPEAVLPMGRAVRLRRALRRLFGREIGPSTEFLGANDGGSSTALLLEMARLLHGRDRTDDIWIVLFDGEEALVEWSPVDQTYGSRHQVQRWQEDGTLEQIRAVVNVDMIGARDLRLACDENSTVALREMVWLAARRCGYGERFLDAPCTPYEDDHLPFVRAGVPALDLIDVQYGPSNGYWHTVEDSPDKLSAYSFGMVAHVLTEVLNGMDQLSAAPA